MSPLSGSMQNVAALAGGNAGTTGLSPLRRVPPALPVLPGRPVAGRAARSTLDVVNEKSKSSTRAVLESKPTEISEQNLTSAGVNENQGSSGVARLIAEANRRAMSGGAPADASVQNTASTAPSILYKEPPSPRPVRTLPVRSVTPVNGNGIVSNAPNPQGVVAKSHVITHLLSSQPPLMPRQPPRKGSLNATTRKTPILPAASGTEVGNGVRSMSVDSVGHVRRMPPPLNDSVIKDETKNNGGMSYIHAAVDVDGASGEKKKARPAVPPKPVHL
ncbi:hypothetical protein QFC21_002697 [Naganishia friedmannii]|uniref:Uncharacterized protein n=1 Tax=Naganishia friedmannii TaxID=89922 RepID=A0ACC2VW98_9TREE|nr:hypothetical protein QFC21_002697 [Naganishia friedmannii]